MHLQSASGTVLLGEDEQKVARTGRQLLEKLGYTALVCHSGKEALALYAERFKGIDAVILDVIMPGTDEDPTFQPQVPGCTVGDSFLRISLKIIGNIPEHKSHRFSPNELNLFKAYLST